MSRHRQRGWLAATVLTFLASAVTLGGAWLAMVTAGPRTTALGVIVATALGGLVALVAFLVVLQLWDQRR